MNDANCRPRMIPYELVWFMSCRWRNQSSYNSVSSIFSYLRFYASLSFGNKLVKFTIICLLALFVEYSGKWLQLRLVHSTVGRKSPISLHNMSHLLYSINDLTFQMTVLMTRKHNTPEKCKEREVTMILRHSLRTLSQHPRPKIMWCSELRLDKRPCTT